MKLNYEDTCGVSRKEIENEGGKLLSIISEMKKSAKRNDYSDCFASINLPFDALMRENIKNLAKEYENKINYILQDNFKNNTSYALNIFVNETENSIFNKFVQ